MSDPTTNAPVAPGAPGEVKGPGTFLFGPDPVKDPAAPADEGHVGGSPSSTPAPSPEIAELRGQVTALADQLKQMGDANMTLMMQPAAPAQAVVPITPAEPEALPDVIDDAAGFATGLTDRIAKMVDARLAEASGQQNEAATASNRYNDLWADFQSTHEAHAGDQRKVRYAANIVAEKLAKRGMNAERFMFSYRDRFMKDVVTEMNEIFGEPKSKAPAPADPDAGDPGRTTGLFGGLDGSGGKPDPDDNPDTDPFKDIRDWQEKTGFHR